MYFTEPFVIVPDSVIRNKNLTPADKFIYATVMAFTSDADGYYASADYTSSRFGISPRSVLRSLEHLIGLGLVERQGKVLLSRNAVCMASGNQSRSDLPYRAPMYVNPFDGTVSGSPTGKSFGGTASGSSNGKSFGGGKLSDVPYNRTLFGCAPFENTDASGADNHLFAADLYDESGR